MVIPLSQRRSEAGSNLHAVPRVSSSAMSGHPPTPSGQSKCHLLKRPSLVAQLQCPPGLSSCLRNEPLGNSDQALSAFGVPSTWHTALQIAGILESLRLVMMTVIMMMGKNVF